MIKNYYDIIVFGGSISAVRYASLNRKQGKSVLLINNYGFLGGAVTESYSCMQSIGDLNDNLINKLIKQNFYKDEKSVLLNPEVVKIILQQELLSSKVDILFHVTPESISFENESAIIYLIAKEGKISAACNYIIDGTEHGQLIMSYSNKNFLCSNKVNMFLTKPNCKMHFENSEKVRSVELNDGRVWTSIKTEQKNYEFYDYGEHALILHFEQSIKSSGSRIQLLPVRSEAEVSIEFPKINNQLFHLSDLCGKNYSISEELVKCQSITKML